MKIGRRKEVDLNNFYLYCAVKINLLLVCFYLVTLHVYFYLFLYLFTFTLYFTC